MRVLDDRPVDSLRRRLGKFEERMRTLRRTIEASGTSRESLSRAIAVAEASSKRVTGDAMAAQERMQVHAEALAAKGHVGLRKREGEAEMLRSRVEGIEACAAWSLIVATRAICDVELATLKAIAARMDLEECSTE